MAEALRLVERAFEAWEDQGLRGLLPFLDEHVRWEVRRDFPDAGLCRGREEVVAWFRRVGEVFEETGIRGESFEQLDDATVLASVRWWGRGRSSGASMSESRESWVFRTGGGSIMRVDEYPSRPEALRAVAAEHGL